MRPVKLTFIFLKSITQRGCIEVSVDMLDENNLSRSFINLQSEDIFKSHLDRIMDQVKYEIKKSWEDDDKTNN